MEKMYTRKEAAALLGVGVASLDEARRNGEVAYIQYTPCGSVFFTEAALNAYIAKCTHPVRPTGTPKTFRSVRKRCA